MTDIRIPDTPDTLTRAQVIGACEALGLDPSHVKEFTLTPTRLDVVLFAIHPEHEGRVLAGDEFVKLNVSIPVERQEDDL
ncbi:hypothetical protein [Escherichia coli]|uniref:hypothetical protein n=1 Tax=Escherichia coli TaxID=562 RepID=UPI001594AD5F|nr:hypothetical protein [Escherichia coli]